jgi:hypothetical protein
MLAIAMLLGLAMSFFFWRVLSKKNAAARKAEPPRPRQSGVQSVYTRPTSPQDASTDRVEQDKSDTPS